MANQERTLGFFDYGTAQYQRKGRVPLQSIRLGFFGNHRSPKTLSTGGEKQKKVLNLKDYPLRPFSYWAHVFYDVSCYIYPSYFPRRRSLRMTNKEGNAGPRMACWGWGGGNFWGSEKVCLWLAKVLGGPTSLGGALPLGGVVYSNLKFGTVRYLLRVHAESVGRGVREKPDGPLPGGAQRPLVWARGIGETCGRWVVRPQLSPRALPTGWDWPQSLKSPNIPENEGGHSEDGLMTYSSISLMRILTKPPIPRWTSYKGREMTAEWSANSTMWRQ